MSKRNVLTVVGLIVLFVAILGNIYLLGDIKGFDVNTFMMRVANFFIIVALTMAVYYLVTGFKKESAKFLKLHIYAFVIAELTTVFNSCIFLISNSFSGSIFITVIPSIIVLIFLNVLLIKNDLGKKVSLILSYGCLVAFLGKFVFDFTVLPTQISTVTYLLRWSSKFSLSFVLIVMQYYKYFDKKERNTK